MGACWSQWAAVRRRTRDDEQQAVAEGDRPTEALLLAEKGGRRLTKQVGQWTHDDAHPLSSAQLAAMRSAFWETAPSYCGRHEVWLALRAACEEDDLATAQAIIDSVGLLLPTGRLNDGAYDELGNRYVVPVYCFSLPRNLIDADTSTTNCNNNNNTDCSVSNVKTMHAVAVKLRLSTGVDVDVQCDGNDTVAVLWTRATKLHPHLASVNHRIFYLGRPLDKNTLVASLNPDADRIVIQAMLQDSE